ncbi:hypothetical protein GGI07_005806 [Coemansia sp. Benny D115]|nr:hypothetical protein GGI07_005806 [Coemansia sp. Benny D115]
MLFKFASVLTLASVVLGHMELKQPCPRYSSKCASQPALPAGESIDYNLNTPIGSGGSILAPFCKHTTAWPQATETWTAGQPVTVSFVAGGATHSGGHCEFSVSYDGGNTYVVIHQELRYCFFTAAPSSGGVDTVRDYTFTLPSNLPGTSKAIFAWTWVNAVGNREFYNNCGDIAIKGSAGSYTGKKMTIANYGAGYPTIPEFLGNYDTGIQYYTTNTTQVTVTGTGYTGGTTTTTTPTSTTSVSATSSAPATSVVTVTSSVPVTSIATPSSTTVVTPGTCNSANEGKYLCTNAGVSAAYTVCSGGISYSNSCSSGTVCKQNGNNVYCDWA